MADLKLRIRRRLRAAHRTFRELKMIAKGLLSTGHPIQVHIIPMRRCNLACAYCNEYDDFSDPVPLEEMYRRIDKLAALGTTLITISGGETLLHPQLDDIIARIRSHGIIAGLITNGYLLTPQRIQQLNQAGLDHLQISIDNVKPDEVSKKSLKVLDKKLQWLREHAEFHVNINSVIGAGVREQWDAVAIGKRAVELGFTSTVGIIHDGTGQLRPLDQEAQTVFAEMKKLGNTVTPASTSSRTTSRSAAPTTGAAVPAHATFMSAKTAWCIIAPSNAGIPERRWPTTPRLTFAANFLPRNPALPTAPSPACIRPRWSISGAAPQTLESHANSVPPPSPNWCRSKQRNKKNP